MQWFLILDLDHSSRSWPPKLNGLRVRLRCFKSLGEGLPTRYRLSPVFPLVPRDDSESADLVPEKGIVHATFFFPGDPFRALGRLSSRLEASRQADVWFSLGAAGLITFSEDLDLGREVDEMISERPSHRERWEITDGLITQVHCEPEDLVTESTSRLDLPSWEALHQDVRGVVDEFKSSRDILLPRVASHVATEVPALEKLSGEVGEMIDELVYLVTLESPVPEGLEGYELNETAESKSVCTALIHQRTDRIVQVNSALSYYNTQLLSGYPPILERRSLIRRFSLLGTTNALRALVRITRHVERAFSAGRVEHVVGTLFALPNSKPLPGFPTSEGHDPTEWERFNVGRLKIRAERLDGPSKIPYFSGRLGFRETEYSISAAVQSLWSSDDVEWTLSTLTHELLHGHVRNVFGQIFSQRKERDPGAYQKELHQIVRTMWLKGPGENATTLESIQSIILSYCCLTPDWGSISEEPSASPFSDEEGETLTGKMKMYPPHTLWRILEWENRNISEILVHVLDLHYFFGSRLEVYLPFLWHSWAAVPGVARDLRQYVLRSLLVTASKEDGEPSRRLRHSADRVRTILGATTMAKRPYTLVPQVLDMLGDERTLMKLRPPFMASLRLVDLARNVLFSEAVREALFAGDPAITKHHDATSGEYTYSYALEELEFTDRPVRSPTGLLLDRLQRAMDRSDPAESTSERRSTWLFLALASGLEE